MAWEQSWSSVLGLRWMKKVDDLAMQGTAEFFADASCMLRMTMTSGSEPWCRCLACLAAGLPGGLHAVWHEVISTWTDMGGVAKAASACRAVPSCTQPCSITTAFRTWSVRSQREDSGCGSKPPWCLDGII
jgi:hypothetical protein